jgi:hypothetical protein
MYDFDFFSKHPEESDRDDDLFEELPDGTTVWRGCVFGMEVVEYELQSIAARSPNKVFAVSLQERNQPIIGPIAIAPLKLRNRARA